MARDAATISLLVVGAAIAAASVLAFFSLRSQARSERDAELGRAAAIIARDVEANISASTDSILSIASFMETAPGGGLPHERVGQDAFTDFVVKASRPDHLLGVAYVPLVKHRHERRMVRGVRSSNDGEFTMSCDRSFGPVIGSTARHSLLKLHAPILYTYPEVHVFRFRGVDVMCHASIPRIVEEAVGAGRPRLGAPYRVPVAGGVDVLPVLAMVLASEEDERAIDLARGRAVGVVGGALSIEGTVGALDSDRRYPKVDFAVYTMESRAGADPLVSTSSAPPPSEPSASETIDLGGQRWRVSVWPKANAAREDMLEAWLVLAGGLVIAGLVMVTGLTSRRSQRRLAAINQDLVDLNVTLEERVDARTVELKVAKEEVERASDAKSHFFSSVSHELRSPLSSIVGFTELLADGKIGKLSRRQRDVVDRVNANSRRLLQLIADLLDAAKIDAGFWEFEPEEVDLRQLIEGSVSRIGGTGRERGPGIEWSVDDSLDVVEVDPAGVERILENFLSNAIKFTAEPGRVRVRALPAGDDRFRIEVEDNGSGISPEDQAGIFDRFRQAGDREIRRRGSGLGLALVRELAGGMGGSVGVGSVLGQGSVFWVELGGRRSRPAGGQSAGD